MKVTLVKWYQYREGVIYFPAQTRRVPRESTRRLEKELARLAGRMTDNHTCASFKSGGQTHHVWFHDFYAIFGVAISPTKGGLA